MVEDPLAAEARAVMSGPPCPPCRFPMEVGFLAVQGGGLYALPPRLSWNDPSEKDDRPGAEVSELWTSTHGGTPWLKGFRCPECEYLELGYGKSGLTRTPRPTTVAPGRTK